jgi:hypothetical protein
MIEDSILKAKGQTVKNIIALDPMGYDKGFILEFENGLVLEVDNSCYSIQGAQHHQISIKEKRLPSETSQPGRDDDCPLCGSRRTVSTDKFEKFEGPGAEGRICLDCHEGWIHAPPPRMPVCDYWRFQDPIPKGRK